MSAAIVVSVVSLALSVLAVAVAGATLWKEHFAPCRALFTLGSLRFSIYPIRNGDESWYIGSADFSLTVTNEGAKPGRILGLRMRITYPHLPINDHYEMMSCKWEIDDGELITTSRFSWTKHAKIWMPFIVLPKDHVRKHLIFECQWTEPVIQDEVDLKLEVYLDSFNDWQTIGNWTFTLAPLFWARFVAGNPLMIPETASVYDAVPYDFYPSDLRRYTAPHGPIPKYEERTPPSFLVYEGAESQEE